MTNGITLSFLHWFFTRAPRDIVRLAKDFLAWAWHYFSIGYFIPRLMAPWHRDLSEYGRGFDLKRFLQVFGWNLISRVIGAILRVIVIAVGLAVFLFIGLVSIIVFFVWFTLPLLGLFLLGLGIFTLFNS